MSELRFTYGQHPIMIMLTHTLRIVQSTLRIMGLVFLVVLGSGCSLISSASARDWVSLGSPPSGVANVIAANGSDIWVSSNEGGTYTPNVNFLCDSGKVCWEWQLVETLPDYAKPISNDPTGPQSSDQCDTLNPNHPAANPNGDMVECIYSPSLAGETIAQFYFALMSDGTIMFLDNSSGFNPFISNSLQHH